MELMCYSSYGSGIAYFKFIEKFLKSVLLGKRLYLSGLDSISHFLSFIF